MKALLITLFFLVSVLIPNFAQDSNFENFGLDEENKGGSVFTIDFGGAFYTGTELYFDVFNELQNYKPPFPLWGDLHIEAKSPLAEAYASVYLSDKTIPLGMGEIFEAFPKPLFPKWIGQAYVQALLGPISFGGGVRKVNWGKADFLSVLDVVNPKDLTKPYKFQFEKIKIASPMFFLSAYLPKDIKLDFLYLPVFEADRILLNGRWEKDLFFNLTGGLPISAHHKDFLSSRQNLFTAGAAKTNTFSYGQGGGRFNISLNGTHDIGFQYFTGFLHKPAFKSSYQLLSYSEDEFKKAFEKANLIYNRYHQIGLDYGAMFGKFTVQAECAVNITEDLKGDKPHIYNPNLAWNFGLSYEMPYNLNLKFYTVQSVRFFASKIDNKNTSLDIEKSKGITDTRLLLSFSQALVRGSLKWTVNALAGIEDADFLINPTLSWLIGTIDLNLSLGFFAGKSSGNLGKYRNNNFAEISIGYEF